MRSKTFGERLHGVDYPDRIGAYAILFDSSGRIAAVQTPVGCFLPGGGVEPGETHAGCVVRECLEEIGLPVSAGRLLCRADIYHVPAAPELPMHLVGYFYHAVMLAPASGASEPNHELLWLEGRDCASRMFLRHQAWAVERALALRTAGPGL